MANQVKTDLRIAGYDHLAINKGDDDHIACFRGGVDSACLLCFKQVVFVISTSICALLIGALASYI
jgi:hypothetical protein